MGISQTTLRAMKMRFNGSFSNKMLMLHWLPNGLYVITFDPDFSENIQTLKFEDNIAIKKEIKTDNPFLFLNGKEIYLPFQATIIDLNIELEQSIPLFKEGPTSSFLLIVKPKPKFQLPEDYLTIFRK